MEGSAARDSASNPLASTEHRSKSEQLRSKVNLSKPAIVRAANNPLRAKLVAEVGDSSFWVGGFELSASYAVPDANILPMSTILEMTRSMAEVTDIPLIVDINTGFGNAVNLAYTVPKFSAAGVAAVVIEDKTFSKDSNLRAGGRQMLVPSEEFQDKIAAAKASTDIPAIARTEALIAGPGQEEAIRRAIAY